MKLFFYFVIFFLIKAWAEDSLQDNKTEERKITGFVFLDKNRNGRKDKNEIGIGKVKILLQKDASESKAGNIMISGTVSKATESDSKGYYEMPIEYDLLVEDNFGKLTIDEGDLPKHSKFEAIDVKKISEYHFPVYWKSKTYSLCLKKECKLKIILPADMEKTFIKERKEKMFVLFSKNSELQVNGEKQQSQDGFWVTDFRFKEGKNTIVFTLKKKDKTIQKKLVINIPVKKLSDQFFINYSSGYSTMSTKSTKYFNYTMKYLNSRIAVGGRPLYFNKGVSPYLSNLSLGLYFDKGQASVQSRISASETSKVKSSPTIIGLQIFEPFGFNVTKDLELSPVLSFENYNLNSKNPELFRNIQYNAFKIGTDIKYKFLKKKALIGLGVNYAPIMNYKESPKYYGQVKKASLFDYNMSVSYEFFSSLSLGLSYKAWYLNASFSSGDGTKEELTNFGVFVNWGFN